MSQARTQEKHGEEKKGKEFVARGGAPAKENGIWTGYLKREGVIVSAENNDSGIVGA